MLSAMISIPTIIISTLTGSFLVAKAAKGAAITPPIIKPKITRQLDKPMVKKKVTDCATVTKNSELLTEPML
jgi:hypothetical protein